MSGSAIGRHNQAFLFDNDSRRLELIPLFEQLKEKFRVEELLFTFFTVRKGGMLLKLNVQICLALSLGYD